MNRTGVDVTTDQAALLFNKDTEAAYQTIIEKSRIQRSKEINWLLILAVLREHKESTEEWQEDNPVLFHSY